VVGLSTKKGATYYASVAPSRISYGLGIVLREFHNLALELSNQVVCSADSILDLVNPLLFGVSLFGLTTHVRGPESVDVVVVVTFDQTSQVLVIKCFSVAGDAAGDFVVVQVDLNLTSVTIQKGVKYFVLVLVLHNLIILLFCSMA